MTREIKRNPFMPSFGRYPQVELAQDVALDDYLEGLLSHDAMYQTALIYGVRGAGKTVMLLNIQRALTEIPEWHFLRLSAGQGNLLFQLLSGLEELAGFSLLNLIKQVQGISLNVAGVNAGLTMRSLREAGQLNYRRLLPEALRYLQQRGRSVLIGIDEVDDSAEIRAFATEYQTLIGEDFPLALLMTGLPSRVSAIQNDQVLTFLLRGKRIYLDPLATSSVRNRYTQVFTREGRESDPVAIDRLANAVGGYAYAFQLLGYYAWRLTRDGSPLSLDVVEHAIELAKRDLFKNVYERLYHDASPTDRRVLRALGAMGADFHRTQDVRTQLNMTNSYFAVYRRRLADAQLIDTSRRGFVKLRLPFLAAFLREEQG